MPITEQIADGYVALVKEMDWNRVAIISHDSELYHRVRSKIFKLLFTSNICSQLHTCTAERNSKQ